MNSIEFIKNFAAAVEVDQSSLRQDSEYKALEVWDSLCALTVIAMIDENYQVTIGGDDIESCVTITDLMKLVETRR